MQYPKNYLEYFKLFNEKKFFEAHEVLEDEWHKEKRKNDYYKGLIQLAAAFVHIQKKQFRGARELFRKSHNYLSPYLPYHQGMNLERLLAQIEVIDQLLAEDRIDWEKIKVPVLRIEKMHRLEK